MRTMLFVLFVAACSALFGQNDTIRLNVVQYDSIKKIKVLGISTRGNPPHRDTILRVGAREYLPEEVAPWFLEYILSLWSANTRTYIISYDSSHICMAFNYSEGKIGNYTEYYRNGNVKTKGQYCPLNGDRKYGTWYFYKVDGTLKRTRKFRSPKYCEGEH